MGDGHDKGPLALLLVEAKLIAGHDEQARRTIAYWETVLKGDQDLVVDPKGLRQNFEERGYVHKQGT